MLRARVRRGCWIIRLCYQQETAEKTPAAATVCSSVSFFACIARWDSGGMGV
jgi:hypothetical protein